MKLPFFCLTITLFSLVACVPAGRLVLPELQIDNKVKAACEKVFPQGHWQFVHSIDFSLEGGAGTTVIGVTNLDGDEMSCALITVEGLTLFEATSHGDRSFEVGRALPPFDRAGFARGLIDDIRTIFLPPEGRESVGSLKDGTAICRSFQPDGSVVDVQLVEDGCWQIRRYDAESTLERRIAARNCTQKVSGLIPDLIELTGYGRHGYSLKMTLIRAEYFP